MDAHDTVSRAMTKGIGARVAWLLVLVGVGWCLASSPLRAADCYLALVARLAQHAEATAGLKVFEGARKMAGADLGQSVTDLLFYFPDDEAVAGVLAALEHVRDARGLDRFTSEMLESRDKAIAGAAILRYHRTRIPADRFGEFEFPVGARSLDYSGSTGAYEFKAPTWTDHIYRFDFAFDEWHEQSAAFLAHAIRRGEAYHLVMDTPMPADVRVVFDRVFADLLENPNFRLVNGF